MSLPFVNVNTNSVYFDISQLPKTIVGGKEVCELSLEDKALNGFFPALIDELPEFDSMEEYLVPYSIFTLEDGVCRVSHKVERFSDEEIVERRKAEEDRVLQIALSSLSDFAQRKIEEINREAELEIVSGIYSSATGVRRKYDSGIVDQLNFMQAFEMAKTSTASIPYRCWREDGKGKEWVPHTGLQFRKVLQDGAVMKAEILLRCSMIKEGINNTLKSDKSDHEKYLAISEVHW